MSDQSAPLTIDPELVPVACHLAHCQPEDLMAIAYHDYPDHGSDLVVVVRPGAKHVFTAQQVDDARKELHAPKKHGAPTGEPPHKEPETATGPALAALKAVARAHPGELEVAEHNAPPAPPATPTPVEPKQEKEHHQHQPAEHPNSDRAGDAPPKKRKAG